jgi:ClpP class serine protease
MEPMNLLWLVFLFIAVQPLLKQRLLEASRQRLISRIERARGTRVILLVHRQETMSLLGFPLVRYIDMNDSEAIIQAIDLTDPEVPIDLVLHTPGGLVVASYQIAQAIRSRKGKVTVFVPHYAMSGGTLIALAADEIVMSPHAVLGPIDPQLGQHPAVSILRVLREKPIEEIDDETLILADQAEKAVRQLEEIVREVATESYGAETSERLSKLLTQGIWTHDHAITFHKAQELGLKVRADLPHDFLVLMGLYPQPVRRIPSVEFTPGKRRKRPSVPGHRSAE